MIEVKLILHNSKQKQKVFSFFFDIKYLPALANDLTAYESCDTVDWIHFKTYYA